jgi:hypothetical protein
MAGFRLPIPKRITIPTEKSMLNYRGGILYAPSVSNRILKPVASIAGLGIKAFLRVKKRDAEISGKSCRSQYQ